MNTENQMTATSGKESCNSMQGEGRVADRVVLATELVAVLALLVLSAFGMLPGQSGF